MLCSSKRKRLNLFLWIIYKENSFWTLNRLVESVKYEYDFSCFVYNHKIYAKKIEIKKNKKLPKTKYVFTIDYTHDHNTLLIKNMRMLKFWCSLNGVKFDRSSPWNMIT